MPRVQVLLPLPKTALLLLQWRCFLSLGGTSWQRGTAAPCAVRVVGRVRASGTQATAPVSAPASVGAGRSPPGSSTRADRRDKSFCPCQKNRRKHWIFAGFLFARVVWEWGSFWFRHRVFSPGFIRSQPLPLPPATKTHPVLPFSGFSGRVFVFFALLDVQNFRAGFCAGYHIIVIG